jgi:hypothetical protein
LRPIKNSTNINSSKQLSNDKFIQKLEKIGEKSPSKTLDKKENSCIFTKNELIKKEL